MPQVDLTDQEWQAVMGILAMAPWRDANPLLMRIGEQLRAQSSLSASTTAKGTNTSAGNAGAHP